ncbi:MAG: hypothetical protein R3F31_19925 [Verrucomicrobiales bacterium]
MKLDDWPSAKTTFEKINNSTKMFIKEKQLRAEANFTFGLALEKTGDLANALKAYTGVWGAYQAIRNGPVNPRKKSSTSNWKNPRK